MNIIFKNSNSFFNFEKSFKRSICSVFCVCSLMFGAFEINEVNASAATPAQQHPQVTRRGDVVHIDIPEGVEVIDVKYVRNNIPKDATSITIPASVTEISGSFFGNYRNVRTVIFAPGSQLKTIGVCAFKGCPLESIEIPASVTEIRVGAFENCKNLKTVTFAPGSQLKLKTIGVCAFKGCPLESFEIPASVTRIGKKAFCGAKQEVLNSIGRVAIIAENVTDKSIPSYNVPSDIRIIADCAFENCRKLTTVTFEDTSDKPSQLKTIGHEAFKGCPLESIEIPASVTEIGKWVFENCSLRTVIFAPGSQLKTIGFSAFGSCPLESIKIPASVTEIEGSAFFECINLAEVIFAEGSQLQKIGSVIFARCPLKSINIPASVTEIGEWAFTRCPLESINIPASVTEIRKGAFAYCRKLTTVTFEDTSDKPSQLKTIGQEAFGRCPLESIEIPASVTEIGKWAFDCVRTVTFAPDSQLHTIGDNAFDFAKVTVNPPEMKNKILEILEETPKN